MAEVLDCGHSTAGFRIGRLENRRFIGAIALFWLAAMIALGGLWRWFLDPQAVTLAPGWLSGLLDFAGSVLYPDPALARRIQISRLMLVVTALSLATAAILERKRFIAAVLDLVNQQRWPLDLAIFRIVVFWQIYNLAYFGYIVRIASLPQELQFPPQTGLPEFTGMVTWGVHTAGPATIELLGRVMKYASIAGILGLFSRTSALVAAATLAFAWGRVEWYGKVDHIHHLIWFALLLAVSPCGDTLSIDALVRKLRGLPGPAAPSRRYGMPLAFAMILMGVIYLFPGLWKIGRSGLDWALSDNPLHTMHREWKLYGDWLPSIRYDRYPFLYKAGALATLLFEISFLFLLLGRRLRYIAALAGLGFHGMTEAVMNIQFESLRNCYVIFAPWGRLWERVRTYRKPADGLRRLDLSRGRVTAIAAIGVSLVAANVWAGATRAVDGWPFACYPPFEGLAQDHLRNLQIRAAAADGSERTIVADDYRDTFGNRWNNMLQRILANGDQLQRNRQLAVVWDVLAKESPWTAETRRVRFFSTRTFVDPDRWRDPPDDQLLLLEVSIDGHRGASP